MKGNREKESLRLFKEFPPKEIIYKFVNINHTDKTITLLYEREGNRGGVTMSMYFFSQYIDENNLTQYKVVVDE